MRCFQLLAVGTLLVFSLPVFAQQAGPVVVQPGAWPAHSGLPSTTRATLPPHSPADVKFMQDMIMHHAQAVEMTALIESHTENKELRSLGARISRSQSDEIAFMKRWLQARGEQTSMPMPHMQYIYGGPSDAHARHAYGKADGRVKKAKVQSLTNCS